MKELFTFLEEYFNYIFAFCALWVVAWALFYALRRSAAGPLHPAIKQHDVLFAERFASGFSHEHRFSGARNALVVVVSREAVLVELIAPVKWIFPVGFNDLEHYILKANILDVKVTPGFWRKSIELVFRTKEGQKKTIELILRKPQEFMSALEA